MSSTAAFITDPGAVALYDSTNDRAGTVMHMLESEHQASGKTSRGPAAPLGVRTSAETAARTYELDERAMVDRVSVRLRGV